MNHNIREKITAALEEADDEFPTPPAAIERAVDLMDRLPIGFPQPDVGVDPNGAISFDWTPGEGIFSVSVDGSGRFSYAMQFPRKAGSGVCTVDVLASLLEAYLLERL